MGELTSRRINKDEIKNIEFRLGRRLSEDLLSELEAFRVNDPTIVHTDE